MKKFKKAFLFYFSLMAISVILQSCCTNQYKIIASGVVNAYAIDDFSIPLDTISEEFVMEINYEHEFSSLENFSVISTTLATTCADEPLNTILTDEVKISLDKDFIFDGNTIAANTDFSNLEGLKIDLLQFRSTSLNIMFQQSFLDKSTFENEDYTFTISSKTDDGLEMESVLMLMVNL